MSQQQFVGQQIVLLYELLEKMKQELAATKSPPRGAESLDKVCDQLTTVIRETEGAVMTIMSAVEDIDFAVSTLSSQIKFKGAQPFFDTISRRTQSISEACTFQDLAGQRLSRAVKSMLMVEGTVNSLVAIVGKNGVQEVIPLTEDFNETPMDGPALHGQGMRQDDIDALFG